MSRMRATVITLLAIAIGLFVYSPVVFANHGGSTAIPWHSDVMTINNTASLGLHGVDFVPGWVRTDCDTVPTNGLAVSTSSTAGCHAFAEEALTQWLNGGWFDPRGGTGFIPPVGDHHRSGWRVLMRDHFSGGKWLTGFAPIASTFPFYPDLGAGPGAGEAPNAVYEMCGDSDGAGPGTANAINAAGAIDTDTYPMEGPVDGSDAVTGGEPAAMVAAIVACRNNAHRAGNLLIQFLDGHGEPLTPGRFPRYIPHERDAWVSTVVTKYTASPQNNVDTDGDQISDDTGARTSQVFRSQMGFVTDRRVTWFSMSNENAVGCAGGWCQWLWDPATGELLKIEGADPNAPIMTAGATPTVADFTLAGGAAVTSINVIDDYNDVVVTKNLSTIEKAPAEVYQTIGQWVQLASTPGVTNGENQAFWQEFWGLSGPNFQSAEGMNPYTWVLCGADGSSPAEENCTVTGGAIDAPNSATMAITQFGNDLVNRYGGDLRPDNSADQGCVQGDEAVGVCNDAACAVVGSACDMGLNTAIVQCVAGGDTDGDPLTSDCESTEGTINGYGNDGTEVIYYREAVENKQRGFIREERAFSFSFINGAGVNQGFPGAGLSTSLRQVVAQNIDQNGFLLSCLNCEDRPEHHVKTHAIPSYLFNWTLTGGVGFEEHANIITGATGSIP